VGLVGALPTKDSSSDEALTKLWECADETECVDVCRLLRSADIRYHVDEIPYERTARMGVKRRYRILISRNDLDRAKEILDIDAPQNTVPSSDDEDEEVLDPGAELADSGLPLSGEPERRDRYLDRWYPEDATVEVWAQDAEDISSGIERSLDANYIHSRCDSDESGRKKILVLPEDESFAREIVREIVEGTPRE
jgi:hypothetical protein